MKFKISLPEFLLGIALGLLFIAFRYWVVS